MFSMDRCLTEARETGHIWIVGEMDLDVNKGPWEAYRQAVHIAECCGYLVSWKRGHSAFGVIGPDILGEIILDWFHPDQLNLVKIEHWTVKEGWTNAEQEFTR